MFIIICIYICLFFYFTFQILLLAFYLLSYFYNKVRDSSPFFYKKLDNFFKAHLVYYEIKKKHPIYYYFFCWEYLFYKFFVFSVLFLQNSEFFNFILLILAGTLLISNHLDNFLILYSIHYNSDVRDEIKTFIFIKFLLVCLLNIFVLNRRFEDHFQENSSYFYELNEKIKSINEMNKIFFDLNEKNKLLSDYLEQLMKEIENSKNVKNEITNIIVSKLQEVEEEEESKQKNEIKDLLYKLKKIIEEK
jgi:hypothetical protein